MIDPDPVEFGAEIAPVRRSAGSAVLSLALHPPRCHLQQPPDRARQPRRHLQVKGLPDRRPDRFKTAEWNLLELGELSRSKVIELNQRCVGQYVSLTRSFLTYNGSLSLTLVYSPPSTFAEWQASIHGGVSDENVTFNSCIGDAAEFDC